jgi:hypothetical protein
MKVVCDGLRGNLGIPALFFMAITRRHDGMTNVALSAQ